MYVKLAGESASSDGEYSGDNHDHDRNFVPLLQVLA